MRKRVLVAGLTVAAVVAATGAAAATGFSFGVFRDQQLANLSSPLFGVGTPLNHSSTRQITQEEAQADPTSLATLAKGLKASVVTTELNPDICSVLKTFFISAMTSARTDPCSGIMRV